MTDEIKKVQLKIEETKYEHLSFPPGAFREFDGKSSIFYLHFDDFSHITFGHVLTSKSQTAPKREFKTCHEKSRWIAAPHHASATWQRSQAAFRSGTNPIAQSVIYAVCFTVQHQSLSPWRNVSFIQIVHDARGTLTRPDWDCSLAGNLQAPFTNWTLEHQHSEWKKNMFNMFKLLNFKRTSAQLLATPEMHPQITLCSSW